MNGLPLNEIIHGNCLITSRQFPDKSSYHLRDETTFIYREKEDAKRICVVVCLRGEGGSENIHCWEWGFLVGPE